MIRKLSCQLSCLVFSITLICCAASSNLLAQSKAKEPHIEVITEKDQQGIDRAKEVRFVSEKGKVLKTMPARRLSVNKKNNFALWDKPVKTTKSEKSGIILYPFTKALLNAKGQEKWAKTFKTYPVSRQPDVEEHSYGYGISDSAGTVFINYRDSVGLYHIVVIDTIGREVGKISSDFWLYDISIAPDAQLLLARTGEGYHIIYKILDLNSKRLKVITASGENLSFEAVPKTGRIICITGHINKKKVFKDILFDNISDQRIQELGR